MTEPYRVDICGTSTHECKSAEIKPNDYPPPGPKGNTIGVIVPKTSLLASAPSDAPETEQEDWWSKLKQGSKEAAQYYKDNISETLHSISGDAIGKGGTVALAGEATAAVGGLATATGIGAPVGGVLIAGGGIAATAGGAVAAGGAAGETAASAMDKAADAILTGQPPDAVKAALELGEKLLTTLVASRISRALGKIGGGGKGGGYVTKGPCDDLKRGKGTGPYRGGAHSETTKPTNDGKDSHHAPAKDVSPLDENDGPAIQMDPGDHRETSSNGQKRGSKNYRQSIGDLLDQGKWREAMAKEIKDIRNTTKKASGDLRKYNEAIREMLEYFKCLAKNGLLK